MYRETLTFIFMAKRKLLQFQYLIGCKQLSYLQVTVLAIYCLVVPGLLAICEVSFRAVPVEMLSFAV